MAASVVIPAAFPVWISAVDGRDELVLDAVGYVSAIAAGATPFTPTTPAKTTVLGANVTRTIAEVPKHPIQTAPTR